jgi:dimethylamine/trimethylamine dehydrogenase
VDQGRVEDIRECIGCNICVSGDMTHGISRCTQNTAFMEEWRKGWHPENARPKGASETVLVVGGGPTGLEAALQLGKRGYSVTLAEASSTWGGRVAAERRLPGLSAWGRVVDYRIGQIAKMPNVEVYRDSRLSADQVLEFGFDHVAIATGATWRRDGVGRRILRPLPQTGTVLTPDDLMAGARPPAGPVVIFDDDHYYMGGVLAELLAKEGYSVTLVTPTGEASSWMVMTMEQHRVQARLLELGVTIRPHRILTAIRADAVDLSCAYTGAASQLPAASVILVTARLPTGTLSADLTARQSDWQAAGISSVKTLGDALAPGTIAAAVWAGRRYAEELDAPPRTLDDLPYLREVTELVPGPLPWQGE